MRNSVGQRNALCSKHPCPVQSFQISMHLGSSTCTLRQLQSGTTHGLAQHIPLCICVYCLYKENGQYKTPWTLRGGERKKKENCSARFGQMADTGSLVSLQSSDPPS